MQLDADDPRHRVVEQLRRDFLLFDEFRHVGAISGGSHFHIDARLKGTQARFALITAITVGDHFDDRAPIAHHEARKLPLFFKNLAHCVAIARRWRAVE